MDGLKEDAEITFILLTNRPEALEAALVGRPALSSRIAVPLSDATGRGKLVRTYGRGLPLDETMVAKAVTSRRGQRRLYRGVDASRCAIEACQLLQLWRDFP
ncbi:hypothetical protein ACM42_02505 [Bradyrhizobium sp. CCBAU 25338]|uniref:hypothetical protein n=1 Tax=Bradyrhizobium sp. CCBAU 45389 TaxID=858429 RepID=UPI0010258A41|nr:hypothetical protein [Bradyrhizobium sp. CCBAU 45389]MDA9400932.1 hypothetical protein [Bradyrhizobium sp. CCBAU 45389]MDA9527322.1 hypothetical protein [Bradyrhizobium sp. CCBAU 25338]RXH24294.1 hypothetical protein XH84_32965 [Bradyrhizobium nanningense]